VETLRVKAFGVATPGMASFGTVMSVWAHPDDESYLAAGLMAMARREGSRVVVVTATRGEGGSSDEERWPSATLGPVRERELLASLTLLGVTEHHFLDLPDIDMDTPLPEVGARRVREIMADVRPDMVLTFGPDGMTGHRGHVSVSRWTEAAFRAVAPPRATLHFATCTPDWAAEWLPRLSPFDLYRPGTPPITARAGLSIDLPLPPDILDLKIRALERHESQVEGLISVFGRDGLRDAFCDETFRPGGRIPAPTEPERSVT
jgi:LmbE family N-acetylglucosaminyl deacetylase